MIYIKPIIGIIMRPELSTDGHDTYCGYKGVVDAILKSNGVPLGIFPPNISKYYNNQSINKLTNKEILELEKMIDKVDGIICQGGDDFYEYDIKVIEYCYKNNIPLLGICLGMQAMSFFFNGQLVDIGNLSHKKENINYVHNVKINKNSHLYKIFNQENIAVNSRHRSKIINTDLKVVGISDDNIIEAVEDSNHKFFIGVQWHPESMIEYDILMNNLFTYFIDTCKWE